MKTTDEFISNARQLIGHPYVFGGNYSPGDKVERNHLLAAKTQYPKEMTDSKIAWLLEHFPGQIGGDCSGTVTHALGLPKIGSAQLWSYCTRKGDVSAIPNIPGLIVYRVGHIGIYLGNGCVLENGSTKYGCKITSINDPITGKAWTGYGYLDKYVTYPNSTVCPYAEPTKMYKQRVRFSGNDALWWQWQLIRIGHKFALDGDAGPKTWDALGYEISQAEKMGIQTGNVAGDEMRKYILSVPSR